mmetsp:Transcript_12/g.40  ORF Transcript_12/g.40 Transcript_12/m.40 type:complete len:262 (+) Transcript_12:70-855(+)|eukprot:CAMPEP_0181091040 /NCGR_PEP_ID=MMETSP1071-20121207/8185_1 /TAXON_ID=35127 /ORGANISM="Thalassiosira sp., Strain NH16" /LENGTH=261 /DNA_ID=CAMNT_0023173151 /DNA_START=160 /DNA_END=945 /DNA_ORIENTATION=-
MSSFGKWYDDRNQQQQQPPSSGGGVGLGDTLGLGSLFSTTSASASSPEGAGESGDDVESQSLMGLNMGNFSVASMRSSLESQLPQKVMGMNYQQRFQVFCVCLLLSAIFFTLGFFVGIPLITVRPQKFALSFTCGSITFMGSFAILKGPYEHFKSMMAYDRIHFTVFYFGTMILTLYLTFTVGGAQGYILVLGASALQLLALMWYLVTFLPGGAMGMKMLTQALWTMLKPFIMGCAKIQAMCISRCVSWYASRFTSSSSQS